MGNYDRQKKKVMTSGAAVGNKSLDLRLVQTYANYASVFPHGNNGKQSDQMLPYKISQIFPKVAQKVTTVVLNETCCFSL